VADSIIPPPTQDDPFANIPILLPKYECSAIPIGGTLRDLGLHVWTEVNAQVVLSRRHQHKHPAFPINWNVLNSITVQEWNEARTTVDVHNKIRPELLRVYDFFVGVQQDAVQQTHKPPRPLFCTRFLVPHMQVVFAWLGAPFGFQFYFRLSGFRNGSLCLWATLENTMVPHAQVRNRWPEHVIDTLKFVWYLAITTPADRICRSTELIDFDRSRWGCGTCLLRAWRAFTSLLLNFDCWYSRIVFAFFRP
jgi:hypothetical protein